MKKLKTFENFNQNINPELIKALKRICCMYKNECMSSVEHPCEYFGDGSYLLELSETCEDEKISRILEEIAEYSKLDDEGSSEAIFDYIGDEDCDYIAQFLGLPPLDYEGDWTDEDEDNWTSSNWM